MAATIPTRRSVGQASPPAWIKPQLAKLIEKAPDGPDWLHEIKFDGYRMHARLDAGRAQILTRRGNDWTAKYPAIAEAIAGLPAQNAYLDGELCGVLPDGRTAFNLIQNATDTGEGSLVFFLFDLLFLDGENLMALPLLERKSRLASLLNSMPNSLRYNDHQIGHGPEFHRLACEHGVEGIVSKRTNSPLSWPLSTILLRATAFPNGRSAACPKVLCLVKLFWRHYTSIASANSPVRSPATSDHASMS